MLTITHPVRRGSAMFGLLLAALALAAPTAAEAQSANQALMARYDAGYTVGVGGSAGYRAGEATARVPSGERALLGQVGAGNSGENASSGRGQQAIVTQAPVSGERALLGRRDRSIP